MNVALLGMSLVLAAIDSRPPILFVSGESISSETKQRLAEPSPLSFEDRVREAGGKILKFPNGWVVELGDASELNRRAERVNVVLAIVERMNADQNCSFSSLPPDIQASMRRSSSALQALFPEGTDREFGLVVGSTMVLERGGKEVRFFVGGHRSGLRMPAPMIQPQSLLEELNERESQQSKPDPSHHTIFEWDASALNDETRQSLMQSYLQSISDSSEALLSKWKQAVDLLESRQEEKFPAGSSFSSLPIVTQHELLQQLESSFRNFGFASREEAEVFATGSRVKSSSRQVGFVFAARRPDGSVSGGVIFIAP